MKTKILSLFLFLLTAIAARAESKLFIGSFYYELGTQDLTIRGESGKAFSSGTISWESRSGRLTLKDVVINVESNNSSFYLDENDGRYLNIVLEGSNRISNKVNSAMTFNSSIGLYGPGSLALNSTGKHAIQMLKPLSLTISSSVYITGPGGIYGSDQTGSALYVNGDGKLIMAANSQRKAAIQNITKFDPAQGSILKPHGGYYSNSGHLRDTGGNIVTGQEVVIGKAEDYGLVIGGVRVTEANYDQLGEWWKYTLSVKMQGASFDPQSRTLTLNSATITTSQYDFPVFKNDQDITIKCSGTNRFVYEANAKNNIGLHVRADLTIDGSGSLDMTNGSDYNYGAIYIDCPEGITRLYNYVNLKTPRVYSDKESAFMSCRDDWDRPSKTGTLTATGHPNGTFYKVLMGTGRWAYNTSATGYGSTHSFDFRMPFKTYAKKAVTYQYNDGETCGVVDENKKYVTGLVEYEGDQTVYPVEIAGYAVTSSNKDNIGNRYVYLIGSDSRLSYDPTNKQLVVKDVVINAPDANSPGIRHTAKSLLTISYVGGNNIDRLGRYESGSNVIDCAEDAPAIVSLGDVTISQADGGKYFWVTEKKDSEQSGWINVSGTLTFDNVDAVSVSSIQAGYLEILHSHLVVRNHLGTDGHQAGRMVDTDIDTNLSDPAYYGEYYITTNLNGEEKFRSKGKVWFVKTDNIERYNVWVAGTQVTSNNYTKIITLFNYNDSGMMYYEPSSRTLVLNNVNMYNHWIDVNPSFEFKGRTVEDYNLVFRGKNSISAFATDNIVLDRACLNIKSDTPWQGSDLYMLNIINTGRGKGGVLLKNNSYLRFLGLDQKAIGSAKCTLPWIKGDGSHTTFELAGLPLAINGKAPDNGPAIDVESLFEYGVESEVVDEEGNTLAIGQGTVVDANGRPATGPYKFVAKGSTVIPPTSITLDRTSMLLSGLGQSNHLTATVKPDNATDATVTWLSDAPEVASVDQEGLVTAVSNGTTTIMAIASNDLAATCQVTVQMTGPTGITLDPGEITIEAGDYNSTFEVRAYFANSEDVSDTSVDWTIEGTSGLVEIVRSYSDYLREDYYFGPFRVCVLKLTASATGAIQEGTCKLVATAGTGGQKAECDITVRKTTWAERVVIQDERDNDISELKFTNTSQLKHIKAKVYPENAEKVEFKLLGNMTATGVNQIAQINPKYGGSANEFSISALSEGSTRLGVCVMDGSKALCYDYIDVIVKKVVPLESLAISIVEEDNRIMGIGSTLQLEVEATPLEANDWEVVWSTENSRIATVDENGLVTGVSYGECTIYATATDGSGKQASQKIFVVDPSDYAVVPVTAITLSRSEAQSIPSRGIEIEAMLEPADANEYIEWHLYDSNGNEAGTCISDMFSPRTSLKCTAQTDMTGTFRIVATPLGRQDVSAECLLTVRNEQIFYVENADGIIICYREISIDDPDNMQCEVFGSEGDPAVNEGISGKLVIPSQVTYNGFTYNVKHITDQAFKRCCYLTEVVVPEGVETIGAEAFSFDESTWALPDMYFSGSLQTVTLPASLKGLGENCFSGQTDLTTVYMNCKDEPGGVAWSSYVVDYPMIINSHPFDNISPNATLYVPDGALKTYYDIDKPWKDWFSVIEEIGTHDCYLYFTEVNDEGVEISYFCSNSASKKCIVQGKLDWNQYLPAVETDPELRNATEITVPEKVRGGEFTVVGIGINAFIRVEGVETIRLPKTIQTLGQESFRDCWSLNDLYMATDVPPTFTGYDEYILQDWEAYPIFDVIGENAVLHVPFGRARYWSYDPWTYWFTGGIVEEDTYFAAATDEGDEVSYRITDTKEMTCEVKGESGSAIDDMATEVEIPEVVEEYVVTGIAAEAFENQYQLTKVTLPASLEYIGYGAFNQCTALKDVYMLCGNVPTLLAEDGNPTTGDNNAFAGLPTALARAIGNNTLASGDGATLHVPQGMKDGYDIYPWNTWFSLIVDDATSKVVHGDVNGDLTVNVADIGSIIDLMSADEYTMNADVNNDGVINVADIGAIIDIMAANARRLKMTYGE